MRLRLALIITIATFVFLVGACASDPEVVEVIKEVVVEKEVVKEVEVPGETVVVEKEVVKEVEVPGETVVVEKEVVKEVEVPGETVVVEKEVVKEVEVVATPAPAAPPAMEPVYSGQVTVMTNNFGAERFDSVYGSTGKEIKDIAGYLVGRDLVDGASLTVPGIASAWELSDDGLTTTFTIRRGVKFHDGTELTAEDVAWSLQHCMGPEAKDNITNAVCIGYSSNMELIEQLTIDQVRVVSTVPIPEMWGYGSKGSGGHMVGRVIPKRDTLWDEEEAQAYDRNPIGAGLIKLVEHRQGESMTFERFEDYYHQPANGFPTDHRLQFSLYKVVAAPDASTRIAALRAGEVDFGRVSLDAAPQIEAGGGRMIYSPQSLAFEVQQWGCFNPQVPCHDKRVRQALSYAIDKELIRDELYGGTDVMHAKGWSVVGPSTIGYSPELDPFPFDPEKAQELLADAGYPGGEGFGKYIINVPLGSLPLKSESGQLVGEMLRENLGLDVEVKVWDGGVHWNNLKSDPRSYDGQLMWTENDGRTDAAGSNKFWYLNYQDRMDDPPLQALHNDPELERLGQYALTQIGREGEQEAFNTWYRALHEEHYNMAIGYINDPWGVGPRIANWEPWPASEHLSALHTITVKN